MDKQEWIATAKEKIKNHEEFITEVEDMVGSDYSRHRSSMERSKNEIKFLQCGIKLLT